MAAFWAVFTFGGSGPDITAHGSLDLKQEIQKFKSAAVFLVRGFVSIRHACHVR
jgi:hypothetical protein